MAFQSESIKGMNIRVFKWKHGLYIDYEQFGFSPPQYGFLVIRVKNSNNVVQPFLLVNEKSVDDLVKSIGNALCLSNLFCLETVHPLAKTISAYLRSCYGKTTFCASEDDVKIVVTVDVEPNKDMMICLTNNMYDIISSSNASDHDSSDEEVVHHFYMYGVQKSDNKRRIVYADGFIHTHELQLARLDIEFGVENPDIQDILDSICNYVIEESTFLCSYNPFDGEKQEFRELLGGLKIMTVGKVLLKNIVHNLELADDTCPICFGKFSHESMVAVITPCSHVFHRSCIFTWLSEKSNCPMCRKKVVVHE